MSEAAREVLVLRHGETEWSASGQHTGTLSVLGHYHGEQAIRVWNAPAGAQASA